MNICQLFGILCLLAFPVSTQADLAQRWAQEQAKADLGDVSAAERALMANKQAVLVTGYMVEAIGVFGKYFSDNTPVLENEFGIPCTIITPPSTNSQQETADQLADAITNLYRTNKKPVILIGHSKGGAESLLMASQHPELVQNGILDRVVLIQAAVEGSPIADELSTSKLLAPLTRNLHGLQSLGTLASKKQFAENLAALQKSEPHTYAKLSRNTYYVRSFKNSADVTKILYATHAELSRKGGSNDGLLLTSGQMLKGFGTDLGILYADHADLTVGQPLSTEKPHFRHAFTRALIREVFRERL